MYSREHRGGPLTFLHSGKLWHDALVLQDRETGSLWSQVLGSAIDGPLDGAELKRVRSWLTTWDAWRQEHPTTRVVPSDRGRRKLKMRWYPHAPGMLGILGSDNPDRRLPGKTRVVGLGAPDRPFAVPLDSQLTNARVLHGGTAFLIDHDKRSGTTVRGSTGPPDWRPLEPFAARVMYWFVWAALYPDGPIVEPVE